MLKNVAGTLLLHKHRLIAWYDYPISTAPMEAANNTIKSMKGLAYGFRD